MTESAGSFDRKSQLADFNRKASAQIHWAEVAIRNVRTVKESVMKAREQEVADLFEMGVEVSAWNSVQNLTIIKTRANLLRKWQLFAAEHRKWQVLEELSQEPDMSKLPIRMQFLATVAREKQLIADLREACLKRPPMDSGLSQLMLSQFEHEKTNTTLMLKNRVGILPNLRNALIMTRQWSAQDEEIFQGMYRSVRELDDSLVRQLQWIKVLYNNQAYFRRSKILHEKMTETLEGSITGRKGQRKFCDDLSCEFQSFIYLWQMVGDQLSRNVHWTPGKRQEMVDTNLQLRKTMEEMLAKLDAMDCPQRNKCVSNFFKDLSSEKMAKTSRKEVLKLLGKFFEIPAEYKEGNGPLVPWEKFVLVCDTGFGKLKLGEKDPPKRTGDVWTDKFIAEWHLVLRKLNEENAWVEENRLELQRANDENNVETVKRLLHEVDLKNSIIIGLKPLRILVAPTKFQQSVELKVKDFVDDRWDGLRQTFAIFKNMCIALLERFEEEQGTKQA